MARALVLIESAETGWSSESQSDDSRLLQLLAQAGLDHRDIDAQSVKLLTRGTSPLGVILETKELPVRSLGRLADALAESHDVISAKMFVPLTVINGSAKLKPVQPNDIDSWPPEFRD